MTVEEQGFGGPRWYLPQGGTVTSTFLSRHYL